jgi:hypothetical protein
MASGALVGTVASLHTLRTQLAALPALAPEEEARQAAMDRMLLDKTLEKQAEAARADAASGPVQSKRRRATFLEGDLLAEDLDRMTDRARRTYKQLGADVRAWAETLLQYAAQRPRPCWLLYLDTRALMLGGGAHRQHLPEPGRVPLHEAVCHNRGPLLRRAFNAQPQLALLTALARPWAYLPRPAPVAAAAAAARAGSAASASAGTSKRALAKRRTDAVTAADAAATEPGPDLCIFYGLYRTSPRLISLADLHVAFAERVRSASAVSDAVVRCVVLHPRHSDRQTSNQQASAAGTRARFVRTLAEAQWLGLIKQTRRRTDHVVRLCWVDV